MKTVIFVWTLDWMHSIYDAKQNYFGIGDIVRGMIATYEVCHKHGFEFCVDIEGHPISDCIHNPTHPYVIKTPVIFISRDEDLENYILENVNNEPLMLMSNNHYGVVYPEVQEILCNVFENMVPEMRQYYEKTKEVLNLDEGYGILHFRLGDEFMVNNKETAIEGYKVLYENNEEKNQLTISDNKLLKDVLSSECGAKILNIEKIGHVGLKRHREYLRDTFVEFLLILHSSKIKTYSIYPWVSGFVTIPAILKNINIEVI